MRDYTSWVHEIKQDSLKNLMLDERWIVELLARCETAVGRELAQIRGNLSSKEWLSGIWELLVMDAALALGSVKYEHSAPRVGRPDLLFDSQEGSRLWIEAAFLRAEKSDRPSKVDEHPVFRVLKKKGAAAKRSDVADPYVVFLGTDRVFDIASSRYSRGVGVDEAVDKAFRAHGGLSAVVLVSIFARAESFKPLQKRPRAWLYANPSARVRLTNKSIDVINRFDFDRWPFDRFTRPDAKRPALREALSRDRLSGARVAESALSLVPPKDDQRVSSYPCWTYVWRFNRLRIARIGDQYQLFNNRDSQNVSASTPGQVAEIASQLFQIFPAHVMGPNGPELHPDPGVPADLREWILELPDKS
jgi:hypothetical protein